MIQRLLQRRTVLLKCKANYVAIVRKIMPLFAWGGCLLASLMMPYCKIISFFQTKRACIPSRVWHNLSDTRILSRGSRLCKMQSRRTGRAMRYVVAGR